MNYEGLTKLEYGVYLVGAPDGKGGANALLANLVMQASANPDFLCVSIGKENLTHDQIVSSGKFNVSVVTEDADMPFLELFGFKSGRDTDKLSQVKCENYNGFPTVVQYCNSVIECTVETSVDCENATVFFGKMLSSKTIAAGKTMTANYYQDVMNGRVPPKAPAYVARYYK